MTRTRVPYDGIDILSAEAVRDPQRYFAPLRDSEPVIWDQRHRSWLVTSHEHVSAALKDPRFSSDRIAPFIESKLSGPGTDPAVRRAFEVLKDWIVFNDPPRHTRLRKLVYKAFTPRAIASMRDSVAELSAALLADVPRAGVVDIKQSYADPLSAIVIANLLGVPPEDRDRFKGWSADVSAVVSAGLDDPDRYTRAAAGMAELARYCHALLERNRAHRQDSIVARLIDAQEADETLSDAEVVATCTLLLFAGHETTANLIANSILALLNNPEQLAALRDGQVEVETAVEELLRFDGPGKAMVRVMAEDCELGGQHLRAGDRVFLVLASADRDPRVFDQPDVLDLRRKDNPHVAFGHGFHFCLGASLARMEAGVAVPGVLREFPGLRLADVRLEWQDVFLARGLRSLSVHVTAP